MSEYLGLSDLTAFGVPGATAGQVVQASALIDGFLSRPEGLTYTTDPRGAPCFMTGANPTGVLTLTTAIAPGLNVVATVTGWVTPDLVGEVLIADRTSAPEALTVAAVSGQAVTFAAVLAAHAEGALLEAGLVIMEERHLPKRRPIARVSRSPLVRLLSGMGRYGFGRRSDQFSAMGADLDLIRSLQAFGSTPEWIPFDVAQASVSPATDEVWAPPGLYLDYFSEVRLRYVAGYPDAPTPVKQACASLVQTLMAFPEMSANVTTLQAGGTVIKKDSASLMSPEIRAMLSPFGAHLFY